MILRHDRFFTWEEVLQNGYDTRGAVFFERLASDFPEFRFIMGRKFAFRPTKTIVIGPKEDGCYALVLHELGHAICKHKNFALDVERLKMESQAWEKAKEIATQYGLEVNEDLVQDELDTYRDWLHQKSRCPGCGLTRFQTPDGAYHCPRCENF